MPAVSIGIEKTGSEWTHPVEIDPVLLSLRHQSLQSAREEILMHNTRDYVHLPTSRTIVRRSTLARWQVDARDGQHERETRKIGDLSRRRRMRSRKRSARARQASETRQIGAMIRKARRLDP